MRLTEAFAIIEKSKAVRTPEPPAHRNPVARALQGRQFAQKKIPDKRREKREKLRVNQRFEAAA